MMIIQSHPQVVCHPVMLRLITKEHFIPDASCAPVNIRYPQDISLLNEARENLKQSFTVFIRLMGLHFQGVMPEEHARNILAFAKSKKHTAKKHPQSTSPTVVICQTRYCISEEFMSDGYAPEARGNPFVTDHFQVI